MCKFWIQTLQFSTISKSVLWLLMEYYSFYYYYYLQFMDDVESVGVSRNRRRKNIVKFSFWIDSNETKPHLPELYRIATFSNTKSGFWKHIMGFVCEKISAENEFEWIFLSQVFSATALRERKPKIVMCDRRSIHRFQLRVEEFIIAFLPLTVGIAHISMQPFSTLVDSWSWKTNSQYI